MVGGDNGPKAPISDVTECLNLPWKVAFLLMNKICRRNRHEDVAASWTKSTGSQSRINLVRYAYLWPVTAAF